MPVARRLIQKLGSVWLAVPVVLGLAAALAFGTWYEARYGTPAVQRDVYRSGWFVLLQAFLAINLAVAALRRWPWRRHHAGFVLVHAGIISILAGGLLGGFFGVQGELVIPEGETADRLQLADRVLIAHQPNPGVHTIFPTAFETRAWQQAPNTTFVLRGEGRTYRLTVDRYLPDARVEDTVVEAAGGAPAIRLETVTSGPPQSVWLWARDPARAAAQWGPAHLAFLEAATPEAWRALTRPPTPVPATERGTLVLTFPWGEPHRVPVARAVGRPVPLAGTPYTVTIQRYFSDIAVTPAGVVNRSAEPRNPAVAFTIADQQTVDAQIAFARMPGFAEAHGLTPTIPVRAVYEHPLADPPLPPNLLGIVRGPAGQLERVVTDDRSRLITRRPIAVGETVTHPTLKVTVRVADYLAQAAPQRTFHPGATREVRQPALHVVVEGASGRAAVWVPEGAPQSVRVDDHAILLEYRPREVPVPFAVTLHDFRKTIYPGTTTAASFESEVTLTDPSRGVTLQRTIRMNAPLKYRGYTVFQASYRETPVETTVLSVRKDPGVPLVYLGFLTVVAGLLAMFYWKPSTGKASAGNPSADRASADKASAGKASAGKALTRLLPTLFLPTLFLQTFCLPTAYASDDWHTLRRLPIQSTGRVKPLDSCARETVRLLTGQAAARGEDPLATVMGIAADPAAWEPVPLLAVPYRPLREALGLDPRAPAISYAQLLADRKLMPLLPPLVEKQQQQAPLTPFEQEVNDLYLRMVAFHELTTGELFRIVPSGDADEQWRLPVEEPFASRWRAILEAVGPDGAALAQATQAFQAAVAALGRPLPTPWRLDLEVRYHQVQPFRVAWLGYLLAALLLGAGFRWGVLRRLGLGVLGAAFALHVVGLGVRILLANRPPVSNLYESMLWLALVLVGLAAVFERVTRTGQAAFAAAVMGAITLVLADQLPFEPGIHPIVAVLRSNLWLTIHVLTIVASYAALTLATGIAHLAGGIYLARRPAPALASVYQLLYRVIQVGVVLLAAGIMLGALWANASWGRYWGWDPKETWALITLLWFVAVLHGRFAGWIRGVGLAAATIGGFLLLLMTYYGVNYFLVGLHSYAGGHASRPWPPLLLAYLTAETIFVGLIAWTARRRIAAA